MKRRTLLKNMALTSCVAGVSSSMNGFQIWPLSSANAAVDGQTILWGGISYVAQNDAELPTLITILDDNRLKLDINATLIEALNSIPPEKLEEKNLNLETRGAQGESRYADYAMVFAIASEMTILDQKINVSNRKMRGTYLRLGGFLFIYDISSMTIVNMFPVMGKSQNYSIDDEKASLRNQYLGLLTQKGTSQNGASSCAGYIKERIENYQFTDGTALFCKVADVTFKERFINDCKAQGKDPEIVRKWVGYSASFEFGDCFKVNVIPYTDSRATRADIAVRIGDSQRVLRGRDTEADCEIVPNLRGWNIKYYDDSNNADNVIVEIVTSIDINIFDTFSGNQLLYSQNFRGARQYVTFKDKSKRQEEFSAIFDVLENLFKMGFRSILDQAVQKSMLKGIKKELGEAGDYQIFLLNTKDPAETEAQAEKVRAFLL